MIVADLTQSKTQQTLTCLTSFLVLLESSQDISRGNTLEVGHKHRDATNKQE